MPTTGARGLSIRARLTLWYTAVFGLLLGAVGGATYGIFAQVLEQDGRRFLTDAAEAVAASLRREAQETPDVIGGTVGGARSAAGRAVEYHRYRDIDVAVFRASMDANGRRTARLLVAETGAAGARRAGDTAGWRTVISSATRALTRLDPDAVHLPGTHERIVSIPVATRQGLFVVTVSQSAASDERVLERIRELMLIGVPLVLLIGALGGYLLAAASLRPVDVMRAQAARITVSNLHERLPVSRPADELARLSETFNALLDRVEGAFEQRRQFTADASHELRTPVAIVIGESELALATDRSPEAYRAALQVIRSEARRLAHIVADLFLLARGDAAEQIVNARPLFLEELVGDCVDAVGSLARAKGVTVEFSPEREVPVLADDALMRRAVINLLDNAIKYTARDGHVLVSTEPAAGGGAVIRVADTGVGIPPEHRERIFERFYRVQHTSGGGLGDGTGAGLGLPIAAWIAAAHGGVLRLAESGAAGTTFELILSGPAIATSAAAGPDRALPG